MAADCPTENEIVARALGTLVVERVVLIDAHVDTCSDCRILLAEATPGANESPPKAASRATFTAGEVIANRYVVIRWLAVGGMGEVYEVHDTCLDERVALKTVIATIADDRRALARLKAEVRMARRVTHENVCRVYDLGFHQRGTEQIAFLTMELLRGTTLRDRLSRDGPLSVESAIPLVLQMVAALGHAHAAGIVHRDFKTDNVMLVSGSDGQAERLVVMDFGLARQALVSVVQPLTPPSRTVLGTLDYMSPEQVIGKHATTASDVYSLGVVLYEVLTGRLPFEGDSPLARASLRVTQKAPRLGATLPRIEPHVEECVARCLEAKPEHRFAAVEEVAPAFHCERRRAPRSRFRIALVALGLGVSIGLALLAVSTRTTASARPAPASPKEAVVTSVPLDGSSLVRTSLRLSPSSYVTSDGPMSRSPHVPQSRNLMANGDKGPSTKAASRAVSPPVATAQPSAGSTPVASSVTPTAAAMDPLIDPD